MAKIRLSQGKFAIVDKEDFDWLNQWKWYYSVSKEVYQGYAVRKPTTGIIYMHRLIIGAKKGEEVDHINTNKCDNRKTNLRITTRAVNVHNAAVRKNNNSGFKGVFWHKQRQKWVAFITINYRQNYLGLFNNKKDAAIAYRKAALQQYGE